VVKTQNSKEVSMRFLLLILILFATQVAGEEMKKDIATQQAVGKSLLALTAEGKKVVAMRQVNDSTYEITTMTSKGTEKKVVSVRQTVGNAYETKEF